MSKTLGTCGCCAAPVLEGAEQAVVWPCACRDQGRCHLCRRCPDHCCKNANTRKD